MSAPRTEAERLLLQWNGGGPESVFLAELRAYRDEARREGAAEVLAAVREPLMHRGDFMGVGGVGGSCYGCRFATPPLDRFGVVADWGMVANDPTEAYFRCSLPGRDNDAVVWGEYAPCTESEWTAGVIEAERKKVAETA